MRRITPCTFVASLGMAGLAGGCGTNVDALAEQYAYAAATTVFDQLITLFANEVAESFEQPRPAPDDGDHGDGDDGGNGDGGNGEQDPGEAAFTAKGCGACHGAEGEGGVGPALACRDLVEQMDDRFAGGQSHNGITLTDQEIADVTAWLADLNCPDGGDGDGGDGGIDGAALFATNCAACHGEDGASGFAPDVTGMSADEIAAGLELGVHASISLTDEEIAAIAEFLM